MTTDDPQTIAVRTGAAQQALVQNLASAFQLIADLRGELAVVNLRLAKARDRIAALEAEATPCEGPQTPAVVPIERRAA